MTATMFDNKRYVSRLAALAAIALAAAVLCAAVLCPAARAQTFIDRNDMDLTVRPGDDFFRYANGGWLDRTEIPPDKASYSLKEIMHDRREHAVLALIEKIGRLETVAEGSPEQIIRDLYATGLDFEKVDAEGVGPLAEELGLIADIAAIGDVQRVIARFHSWGFDPLFSIRMRPDLEESDVLKLHLLQGGLGLPDAIYYTHESARAQEIRKEYVKHIARIFELLGETPEGAAAQAEAVMAIEMQLAGKSLPLREKRKYTSHYHPKSVDVLRELCPGFDWKVYFETLSETDFGDVVVDVPDFFEEMGRTFADVSVADWKAYIRWHFVDELAGYLGGEFVVQNHRFYGGFLKGTEEMGDRRAMILDLVSGALGEIVGRLYVEEHFKPEAKAKMIELTGNLRKALASRIERLDWLGDETRKQALAKLEAMRIKVGYPDKWKDYSGLVVKRDSFVLNLMRLSRFLAGQRLGRFGQPPDPDEWPLPPQLPNAGYFPQRNEIIFPAGILQPPLLDLRADDAVIYGSIGVGIAHEMIHGFDDQGRKFDKDGNLNEWWAEEEVVEYGRRVKLLVDQYGGFAPFDDLGVDGELTLGENIADFGGLTVALDAYKLSLNGQVPEPIDDFTHEQRFFLAFAKFFRGKIRDDALRRRIREDKHPWVEYRVNGAPFNVPEFYLAFDIRPTDRLYRSPEQRPVIW